MRKIRISSNGIRKIKVNIWKYSPQVPILKNTYLNKFVIKGKAWVCLMNHMLYIKKRKPILNSIIQLINSDWITIIIIKKPIS